ncbi:hypothetical protein, partial [Arthrobacter ulcerisalmonis]
DFRAVAAAERGGSSIHAGTKARLEDHRATAETGNAFTGSGGILPANGAFSVAAVSPSSLPVVGVPDLLLAVGQVRP